MMPVASRLVAQIVISVLMHDGTTAMPPRKREPRVPQARRNKARSSAKQSSGLQINNKNLKTPTGVTDATINGFNPVLA